MISGLEFSNKTIASEEKKYIDEFYKGDNTLLSDSINYYSVLFTSFLVSHKDNNFRKLSEKEQSRIIDKEESRFQTGMIYAFNKGHQTCFSLLLLPSSQEFHRSFFEKPESHDYFLFTYNSMISDDVFRENLTRDAIDMLIQYTRKYFEGGYTEIMNLAAIFFRKGIGVAYEQIRKNIVKAQYKITGHSRMLNVPYNEEFQATPAFKATFSLESPGYEEWDMHWDETYGFEATKELVAKVMIHRLKAKTIRSYSQKGAKTYSMIKNNFLDSNANDETTIYLIRIDFLTADTDNFPRLIQGNEYKAIRLALTQTICRRLQVDSNKVFVSD